MQNVIASQKKDLWPKRIITFNDHQCELTQNHTDTNLTIILIQDDYAEV